MNENTPLLDLYHEDRRLDFLARRLAALPGEMAAVDADLAERAEASRRRESEAEELAEALRRLERDGAARQDELEKLRKQQKAVSSVEALAASETALARCERQIAEIDDKCLVKLEAQEIFARENKLRAGREKQEAEVLAAERAEKEREQADCLRDREETELRREALVAAIDEPLRRRYLRIHGRQGHRTLAPLLDVNCGTCGEALPPQQVIEIKENGAVVPCQGCGRLVMNTES